jgi:cupin superfamily acireductone dioxygenase involved in methionine salvage
MENKYITVKKIAKELALEDYKPVMILKLSKQATMTIGDLKEFVQKITKETGYTTLVFPNENETSGKIISIYDSEKVDIDVLKEYIYGKYGDDELTDTPYTKIKDLVGKKK